MTGVCNVVAVSAEKFIVVRYGKVLLSLVAVGSTVFVISLVAGKYGIATVAIVATTLVLLTFVGKDVARLGDTSERGPRRHTR